MITPRPFAPVTLILCLCILQLCCFAQDKLPIQFGKVSPQDFTNPVSVAIDSSSSAIILADIGSVSFIGNNKSWFSHVFKRTTRIKILNKKAFEYEISTVKIPLYTDGEDAEKLSNLLASTYNLDNGTVTETKLDKKDIFTEKENKNYLWEKFTLPAVREGSIIEYTYTITSDYNFNLPYWEFQSMEYPTILSEYDVEIPQTFNYVMVKQGVHSYAIDKGSQGHASYTITGKNPNRLDGAEDNYSVNANTDKHRWVMKDVPAFRAESYLTTPWNYVDKIEFQLAKTYDGQDWHDVMNTWKKATEELLKRDDFGQPLSDDNSWMEDWLAKLPLDDPDLLQEAKNIYYYLSSHFSCTDHHDKYIKTTLKDVYKKNSGSVGDLNLLLIAVLRKKGFTADPVLLSTRERGYNLAKYPVLDRLDYVIARVVIAHKVYYLDIAHPQLGFGQLAGNCFNGHARIISNTDSGSVYFEPDSLKEKKTTMVLLSFGPKGFEGSCQSLFGMQESYNTRVMLQEVGEKAYFKKIQAAFGEDWVISNSGVDSLTKLEEPLNIHFDLAMRQAPDSSSLIYLNPLLYEVLSENPFKAADRKYPVEMNYAIDNIYLLNMDVPEGYTVEELPKSTKVAFNDTEGFFEYMIASSNDRIQLRCRLKLNKAIFSPDDYSTLRDLYGFIVRKESEQIVLKKK